jgi:catalase (peroxidase I)
VKLNSSTLTVSKLVASGTTSVSTFATITISDRRGTTTTVRVNYFR